MAFDKVYQMGGALYHGECLADEEVKTSTERKRDDLDKEDFCEECTLLFVDDSEEDVSDDDDEEVVDDKPDPA